MDETTEVGSGESKDRQVIVRQLAEKADTILSLAESDAEERTTRSLALMNELEAAGTELDGFCETVGEGDNRIVIMSAPVNRQGAEKIDWTRTGGQIQDIGVFHSEYREYLFFSRKGVSKLSLNVKRETEFSQNAEDILNQTNDNDLDGVTIWSKRNAKAIEYDGNRYQVALNSVTSQGAYEPFPDEDFRANRYPTERRSKWEISQQLDPNVPLVGVLTDREFDSRDRLYGFGLGPVKVRVTKPQFVSEALEASSTHKTQIAA